MTDQSPQTSGSASPHESSLNSSHSESMLAPQLEKPSATVPDSQGRSPNLWNAVTQNLTHLGGSVGHTASQAGKTALHTVTGMGGALAQGTRQAAKAASELGEQTAKHTQHLLSQATHNAGKTASLVSSHPILRKVGSRLNLNWLVDAINQVDVVKAEAAVRELQQRYPQESPSQIAHRIMLQKAIAAGGVGLASSLIPGMAVALLTVDLAANLALQAEMVYQIAAAYGLKLQDPARQGEILAIFGLALGGGRALKVGLGLLRNAPIAGAIVGASANAAMLYSLGYAACRFYETQLNEDASEQKLAAAQTASQEYLEVAIAQQALMDQVLVHMLLASTDKRSWDDILPTLKSLNLHPASLKAIAANIQNPQPLYLLLNQLNRDFAAPLFVQCQKIACLDGRVTPPEAKILETIQEKFDLEVSAIAAMK